MTALTRTAPVPRILRGDILNWLRPECVQRPSLKGVSYRANLALEAIKTGRIELAEEFLGEIIERLSRDCTFEDTDQIVSLLKGTDRLSHPIWPFEDLERYTIPLSQISKAVVRDYAYVPGGSLAVLVSDHASATKALSANDLVEWRLVWVDLIAKDINHVYNLGTTPRNAPPTRLVPGWEDDVPLAVLQGSTLTYFDTAGFPFETVGPLFDNAQKGPYITSVALHPDTAELIAAVQRYETTFLLKVGENGRAAQMLRFPGQIDRIFVAENLIIALGLRDAATMDLVTGATALRDLYPYFADQPVSTRGSVLLDDNDTILVHEGRKLVRASRNLRQVEREFLLDTPADFVFHWGNKLVRVASDPFLGALDIVVSRPIA